MRAENAVSKARVEGLERQLGVSKARVDELERQLGEAAAVSKARVEGPERQLGEAAASMARVEDAAASMARGDGEGPEGLGEGPEGLGEGPAGEPREDTHAELADRLEFAKITIDSMQILMGKKNKEIAELKAQLAAAGRRSPPLM